MHTQVHGWSLGPNTRRMASEFLLGFQWNQVLPKQKNTSKYILYINDHCENNKCKVFLALSTFQNINNFYQYWRAKSTIKLLSVTTWIIFMTTSQFSKFLPACKWSEPSFQVIWEKFLLLTSLIKYPMIYRKEYCKMWYLPLCRFESD